MRAVALMALRSHMLAAVAFGPCKHGEHNYARQLRQDLWGVLLAYNLVRREMKQVAKEANLSPLRFSFIAPYRFIRDEFLWCAVAQPGAIPAHLKRSRQQLSLFLLPKRRSARRYRRAVKRESSQYPLDDDSKSEISVNAVIAIDSRRVIGVANGDFAANPDQLYLIDLQTGFQELVHEASGSFVIGEAAYDPDSEMLYVPDASENAIVAFAADEGGFVEVGSTTIAPGIGLPPTKVYLLE